ncbi:MAG: hypothetical protein ACYCUF_08950 [Acidimicrobiales bacterium]
MVEPLAVDPTELSRRIAADPLAARGPLQMPPRLLEHPLGASLPEQPALANPDLAALHLAWQDLHDQLATQSGGGIAAGRSSRRRLGRRSRRLARIAEEQNCEREMIGHLIRLTNALAERCDDLAKAVGELSGALCDAFAVTSEDMARLAAKVASPVPPGPPGDPIDMGSDMGPDMGLEGPATRA